MIKFIKILSYELKPQKGDVFDYLASVTCQSTDPPSLEPGKLKLSSPTVLHSTLLRAEGCIQKKKNPEYISTNDLNEIPFDLEGLCGRDLWNKYGSVAVRQKFKEGFLKDQLLLSRKEIFDGVRRVLSICQKKSNAGDVSVVSHSFRLVIIEAYIKTEGLIEKEPALISDYISDDKKRYEFGGGFEILSPLYKL